jgi:dCTP diphosphatase
MKHNYDTIRKLALDFRSERDWQQFHTPKDLAEGLTIEAAELLENFLWKTPDESRSPSPEVKKRIEHELSDILLFLIYLCQELDVDLFEAAADKIRHNAGKYPVEKSKGSNKKYTEL